MKKLLTLIALALCGTLFAAADKGMTSSNVVGYQIKGLFKGFNYITPMFDRIDGSKYSVQTLEVATSGGTGAAKFRKLDYMHGLDCNYAWYTIDDAIKIGLTPPESAKKGVWVEAVTTGTGREQKTTYSIPEGDVIEYGDGIQVYCAFDDVDITFAGSVSENDMVQVMKRGYNYVGNPFAHDVEIQDFQMDRTVGVGGAKFQFINYMGGLDRNYAWYTAEGASKIGLTVPEGLYGVWVAAVTTGTGRQQVTTYSIPNKKGVDVIAAGDAVQVCCTEDGKTITVLCPYELK